MGRTVSTRSTTRSRGLAYERTSNIGWASEIVASFSDPCCCSAAARTSWIALSPLVGVECSPPASRDAGGLTPDRRREDLARHQDVLAAALQQKASLNLPTISLAHLMLLVRS